MRKKGEGVGGGVGDGGVLFGLGVCVAERTSGVAGGARGAGAQQDVTFSCRYRNVSELRGQWKARVGVCHES